MVLEFGIWNLEFGICPEGIPFPGNPLDWKNFNHCPEGMPFPGNPLDWQNLKKV